MPTDVERGLFHSMLSTHCIHIECILSTHWVHIECILSAYWVYIECILSAYWVPIECISWSRQAMSNIGYFAGCSNLIQHALAGLLSDQALIDHYLVENCRRLQAGYVLPTLCLNARYKYQSLSVVWYSSWSSPHRPLLCRELPPPPSWVNASQTLSLIIIINMLMPVYTKSFTHLGVLVGTHWPRAWSKLSEQILIFI